MLRVDSVERPVLPTVETNDCVEAGKGVMKFSALSATCRYEISGPAGSITIQTSASDTLLMNLPAGVYSVQAVDVQSGCESEIEKDTIREPTGRRLAA